MSFSVVIIVFLDLITMHDFLLMSLELSVQSLWRREIVVNSYLFKLYLLSDCLKNLQLLKVFITSFK